VLVSVGNSTRATYLLDLVSTIQYVNCPDAGSATVNDSQRLGCRFRNRSDNGHSDICLLLPREMASAAAVSLRREASDNIYMKPTTQGTATNGCR
jgi:hypothetical protein